MLRSNVLIVVVDGLRASALGAYGNTLFPTPALDEFAADSLLFDWCYAASADLDGIYNALLCSRHPARFPETGILEVDGQVASQSLLKLFAATGYQTTLVTDESRLAAIRGMEAFHNHVPIAPDELSSSPPSLAEDDFESELAHVFAAASEAIGGRSSAGSRTIGAGEPRLVWLHARGMYGAWDAPLKYQDSLRDEDDPPPVESVVPPNIVAAKNGDPDAVFRYLCAYAAQVMVFDTCWQRLLEFVDECADAEGWLVMLMGARGFPLGEHGRIGGVDARLYTEQLHVPLLIRFPDRRERLRRESGLVTHLDVLPTLLDWIGGDVSNKGSRFDGVSALQAYSNMSAQSRDALLSVDSDDGFAIRTGVWCLRDSFARNILATTEPESELSELFVRPDDRWEANDVSKLCPQVVDDLRATALDWRQQFATE